MYCAYFCCCEDLYDIQPSWNDRRTFFFLSKHTLFAVWVSDWFMGISLYTDFEFWISMLACLALLSSYSNIPHAKLLEYSYIQPSLYYCPVRKFQCLPNYLQYNIKNSIFSNYSLQTLSESEKMYFEEQKSVITISLASNL